VQLQHIWHRLHAITFHKIAFFGWGTVTFVRRKMDRRINSGRCNYGYILVWAPQLHGVRTLKAMCLVSVFRRWNNLVKMQSPACTTGVVWGPIFTLHPLPHISMIWSLFFFTLNNENVIRYCRIIIWILLKLSNARRCSSVHWLGYGLDDLWFEFCQDQEICFFTKPSRRALCFIQNPIRWIWRFFPGCEAAGVR